VALLVTSLLAGNVARADDPRVELGSPIDPDAPAPRPRIRAWQITLTGLGYGEIFSPRGSVPRLVLGLAIYGRLAPWASLGARIMVAELGYSDLGGVILHGGLALPSVRFSFREELDSVVAIEGGLHLEAGFYGGTRTTPATHDVFGEGAFGAGGGLDLALDLGPSNAIVLDLVLEGWGARGSFTAWLFASLGYAVRFD
jgi:hypothetical protein